MPLIDEIVAKTESLGLPTNLTDRRSVPCGNMVSQLHVTESRAGRLVRQLEEHFRTNDRSGPLGERFRRIQHVQNR